MANLNFVIPLDDVLVLHRDLTLAASVDHIYMRVTVTPNYSNAHLF